MNKLFFIFSILSLLVVSCQKEPETNIIETTLEIGQFPTPNIPNVVFTDEKIALGKKLFYEKLLSRDERISCASCHLQSNSFADVNRVSIGVDGTQGLRNSPAIINMAWNTNGFFWDGRASTLRDQALMPITDHLEMKESLDNVVSKLSSNSDYPFAFENAFGESGINALNISLALEQFMFTIISNNSKYDQFLAGSAVLTVEEDRGRRIFFGNGNNNNNGRNRTNCASCHSGINFQNNEYANIGLNTETQILRDLGRGAVTNNANDNGKFKVPTLRNVELTAPYMHDGRFSTLEQVLDHYDNGIINSSTLNQEARNLRGLNGNDKRDIIAFLKTLTDHTLENNPAFAE